MNTTEIHIEHFMSGVLSLTSLMIMAVAFLPINPEAFQIIFRHETLAAILAMSVAYPLGIFSDNVADKLLHNYERSMKIKGETVRALIIKIDKNFVTDYFNYNRVRIRIARSTWLNFLLISMSIATFYIQKIEYVRMNNLASEVYFCIATTFLVSLYALANWYWITKQNCEKVHEWSDEERKKEGQEWKRKDEVTR